MAEINTSPQTLPKEEQIKTKKKKYRIRTALVLAFLAIFSIGMFITCRADYLETLEIGENYLNVFNQNIKYKIFIAISNFIFIFITVFITNLFIKKGLRKFFEQEKIEMPKLPNKSIALIFALIVAMFAPNLFLEKVILFINNAWFGISDPLFNMDVGFYMFQAPLIGLILYYLLGIVIALTIYIAIYYIIVFNTYFEGIDGQTLKNNTFIKHLLFNVMIITFLIVGIIIFNMQNIVLDRFLNINNDLETSLVGAGIVEKTVKLWGYRILGVVIILSISMAIKFFRKENSKKVIKSLAIVPTYLVALFIVMVGYKMIFIEGSELDKEKSNILSNINFTKTAYNIKIEEKEIDSTGTIKTDEAEENEEVINNIPIVTEDVLLNNLKQTQTSTGYYTYNQIGTAYYNNKLTYISAREINSANTTYKSEANEYTHGYGAIQVSASETDENGNIKYISKDFESKNIKEPRIYYGMETNSIINVSNNIDEFDYPKSASQNEIYKYNGEGGISLGILDKAILSIKEKKLGIILSGKDSKVLLNRNIRERAKKIMPNLLYDENPYLVIGEDGNLYWVLDAYTISNEYPYSQKTRITYENDTREINYIRNSVKVIVDAFNGNINFYIMDKTDPIIMVYNNMYENLFKEENEIPEGISKYFTYSKFLYNIQSEILAMYHDVSPDVLYRGNDVWQIASYSNLINTSIKSKMEPFYTMVKTVDSDENELGLVTVYNLYGRESLNAYLVGTVEDGQNTLTLYKFSNDSSVIGPMQLDKLIEQDETISSEISNLNVTGTRITKEIVIVPINNTLLYVIPIYQTSLNEAKSVPILKNVVIASGNKLAMGETLGEALKNLLFSDDSVSIEVEDTDTIEGLIEQIIKANNNLTESNNSNDWTQIGTDIEELQKLIKQLEVLSENEKNKENEENKNVENNNNVITDENILNNITN